LSDAALEKLMNLLDVQVDAFALCEIARTAALTCDPSSKVVVHFVLHGEGIVQCDHGTYQLHRAAVLIVPRGIAKVISGAGLIDVVREAKDHCSLGEGLVKFTAGAGEPDLLLGCAAVDASIDGVVDVFAHLSEPMIEDAGGPTLAPLLDLIRSELSNPGIGSQAVVSGLMKQVLIAVFRGQLSREAFRSWLWPAMLEPQLGKAALAMMARPQDSHTVESLAGLAGMSRSQFSEKFASSFGRAPIEFLQAVRMRAAQRMLKSSALPIKAIAAAVGYSSRSHFSRSFQVRYGTDPSEFRRLAQLEQT
jgi:AraC-like DNA-binding protein